MAIRPICVPLERMLELIDDVPADARIVAHGTGYNYFISKKFLPQGPDREYVFIHVDSSEFAEADQGKPLELKDANE